MDVIFSIETIQKVTPQLYSEYINGLTRFSDTISGMNNDCQKNPWYGAKVKFISNELRHDILSYLDCLISKVEDIAEFSKYIISDLSISIEPSFLNLKKAIQVLEQAGQSPKVPLFWLTDSNGTDSRLEEIIECEKNQEVFFSKREKIRKLHQDILENDSGADFSDFSTLATMDDIEAHISAIYSYYSSSCSCYSIWEKLSDQSMVTSLYTSALEQIEEYNAIYQELSDAYENEIFSIDFNTIYLRFKTDYNSAFKVLKIQYWSDKKLIQGLSHERGKKLSDDVIFELLGKLRHMAELKKWMDEKSDLLSGTFGVLYQEERTDFTKLKRFLNAYELMQKCIECLNELKQVAITNNKEKNLCQHFECLYSGIETNWSIVKNALDWAVEFKYICGNDGYGKEFFGYICNSDKKINICKTYSIQLKEKIDSMIPEFDWFLQLFQTPDEWRNMPMFVLTEKLTSCRYNLAALEEWIDFCTARDRCYEMGLKEYIDHVENMHIDAKSIVPVFQKRFFNLWLDSVLPEYPEVANFRRRNQEYIIREFKRLDKMQFSIARSRIRAKLINGLPSLDHFTTGVDEISILKRELNKQRRIMPIRRLFREIPNLILTLKPCLMMSPLSVSLFLEADTYSFDTVIFDEASQVCTENAVGAILRGKQVIIAGDSKQLPPTNFFTTTMSDNDFDEPEEDDAYNDSSAYESVLDEAALLPERTLLWHYRSRHEHLIAFSNAKIYKGNLITFPSNIEKAPDIGVEYTYVPDGCYDRGGRKGNVIEAEKVVDLIFEHLEKYPDRSLGVITFGEVQQLAIDTILRRRRMEEQKFEHFFAEDRQEAFFIKSLENVQGDERDTIIFSIGYAKDMSGVMRMNFGPLSRIGGERRLNVAITRAKYNVKLVGSILPTDINVERISADGPKLLRTYIDFAINGSIILQSESINPGFVQHDSPFEEVVYNFLTAKGYKVVTQVGCSGYRIDMAVMHPTLSGRYVLGIECDGVSYHSARTARERDRLRQDVLENMGWKIYRIWSTDWIKDPVTEGQRLLEAVDESIDSYTENIPANILVEQPKILDTFMNVEEKSTLDKESINPYEFDDMVVTDFSEISHDNKRHPDLLKCIRLLVDNEYPIHYDLLCQKLSLAMGKGKVTLTVRREIDEALKSMQDTITKKGEFFYPSTFQTIPVHLAGGRNIKHISTDELAAAMLRILNKCVGMTRLSLIDETTRALGFSRRGANITKAMNAAFEQLVMEKKIQEIHGKIIICN